jgi:hypothetical protein
MTRTIEKKLAKCTHIEENDEELSKCKFFLQEIN